MHATSRFNPRTEWTRKLIAEWLRRNGIPRSVDEVLEWSIARLGEPCDENAAKAWERFERLLVEFARNEGVATDVPKIVHLDEAELKLLLRALPPQIRAMTLLHLLGDMTIQEAAKAMKIRLPVAHALKYKSKMRIRELLYSGGWRDDGSI